MKNFIALIFMFFFALIFISCPSGQTEETFMSDPQVLILSVQHGLFPSSASSGYNFDSYIKSDLPADTAGNTEATLYAGKIGADVNRILITFDLQNYIFPGMKVKSAYLTLGKSAPSLSLNQIDIYPVTKYWYFSSSWNQAGTADNWSNPGGDFNPVSVLLEKRSLMDYDLFKLKTGVVQNWVDNPASNYGLIIKAIDESAVTNRRAYCSNEYATPVFRPKLTIYYTID